MRDNKQTLKIELLSQWKLEAEFCNVPGVQNAQLAQPRRGVVETGAEHQYKQSNSKAMFSQSVSTISHNYPDFAIVCQIAMNKVNSSSVWEGL